MMTDHKAFQLANVRVPSPRRHRKRPGSARRAEVTSKEETRRPRLIPGIYALCEIQSAAYPGAGANDVLAASNVLTVCANHHRGVLILVVATASDD
jgi:hypothetical protein